LKPAGDFSCIIRKNRSDHGFLRSSYFDAYLAVVLCRAGLTGKMDNGKGEPGCRSHITGYYNNEKINNYKLKK
jgi:hypothetical protein